MTLLDKLATMNGTKEDDFSLFKSTSLTQRVRENVRQRLDNAAVYRVAILNKVNTFMHMAPETLRSAADSMDEIYYNNGDHIIKQDDIGDSFFILEHGLLEVTRKMNPANPDEQPKLLNRLGNNSYFGEISLLTLEPRSATVTVISDTAKALRMTKARFDEITKASNKIMAESEKEIGNDVISTVPIFKSLTKAAKTKLVACLIGVSFNAGTYICRQGAYGNTFYIIIEGDCRVTINTDEGEKEVSYLCPGDFFGEIALIDKSCKRTANVMAKNYVKTMTLSRQDFELLLKNLKNVILEYQAMKGMKLTKDKDGGHHVSNAGANSFKRRICGFNAGGQRSEARVNNLMRRFGKFVSEALWDSMYSRLFIEVTLHESKLNEYGDCVIRLKQTYQKRYEFIDAITAETERILSVDMEKRTSADHGLVYGLMKQRSLLRKDLCHDWPGYHFSELCKKVKFMRVQPLMRIIEADSRGNCFFLILRGAVRIYRNTMKTDHSTGAIVKKLVISEDLFPGEYFGEDVLSGMYTRMVSAQALTVVDLIIIDEADFSIAKDHSHAAKMSVEDKYQFLLKVSIVKEWEPYSLYRLAHSLTQVEYEKGNIVVNKGEVSNKLMFVVSGRIDVVQNLHKKEPLISIERHQYLGETGLINFAKPIAKKSSTGTSTDGSMTEEFSCICKSRVDMLELDAEHFSIFNEMSIMTMKSTYLEKITYRNERSLCIREERIRVRKFKKEQELKMAKGLLKATSITPAYRGLDDNMRCDVDDIPVLLRDGYDPFMILPTCKTTDQKDTFQENLSEVRRPKSARVRERSAHSARQKGVSSASVSKLLTQSSASVETDDFNMLDSYDFLRQNYTFGDSPSKGGAYPESSTPGSKNESLSPQRASFSAFSVDRSVTSFSRHNIFDPNINMLKGSMRIPSAKSYRESCITHDELKEITSGFNETESQSSLLRKISKTTIQ